MADRFGGLRKAFLCRGETHQRPALGAAAAGTSLGQGFQSRMRTPNLPARRGPDTRSGVAHHGDYCRARELNPTNRYLQQPKQGNAEVSHATPTCGGWSRKFRATRMGQKWPLSAMVSRPTGRNWVRADRFGGQCKAFLCRGGIRQGNLPRQHPRPPRPRRRGRARSGRWLSSRLNRCWRRRRNGRLQD